VQAADTLASIRDAFVQLINANPKEFVTAQPAIEFTRVRLQQKTPGKVGEGLYLATTVSTAATNTSGASLTLTATNTATCCANTAGAPITPANPAVPGETIVISGTGLGLDVDNQKLVSGQAFPGPPSPLRVSLSAQSGGSTVNVINAGYKVGAVGINEIVLELPPSLPANPLTQLTISQSFSTSNIVTIPVGGGSPTSFVVVPETTPIAAGTSMLVTVAAHDSAGNTSINYSGTVHFTSSDPAAVLPPDSTLVFGVSIFTITFKTTGVQTITATDISSGAAGTSLGVTVQ
jgi:uncharacterized protein (TIGR03437 family)